MIAYLSGAMENAKNDGSEWRSEITIWLKEKLGHSVIDPVIEKRIFWLSFKLIPVSFQFFPAGRVILITLLPLRSFLYFCSSS